MKKMAMALALAATLGVAQASSVLVEPERVTLAAGATAPTVEQVKDAIMRGAAAHEWTVVDDQPGKLQLKHNKQNKHEAVVEVAYDTTGFQVRYVNSVNLKYQDKDGARTIHAAYNIWVRNLVHDISVETTKLTAAR